MDYRQIKQGSRYELSGNTFANKDAIRSLGAEWSKDSKTWTLDLTNTSKSAFQSRMSNVVFKLSRSGVNFAEAR